MKKELKAKDKKDSRREKIIEAASVLFSEMNFHEVMMDDVAREASVAKGTLYNYFPSKEHLYFSIIVIRLEKLVLLLKDKIEKDKDPLNSLQLFVTHVYDFFVSNNCFYLMLQKESLNKKTELCEKVKMLQNELKEILTGILKSGKNEHCILVSNVELAADFILGAINGTVNFRLNKNSTNHPDKKNREEMFNYLLKGIKNPENINPLREIGNKTIVLTGSADEQHEAVEKLKKSGAKVILFPTIEIVPPSNWSQFDLNMTMIGEYDFLVFTSSNAVKMFWKRCSELGIKINYLDIKVAVVGKKTAESCQNYDIPVNILPDEYSAKGLIKELLKHEIKGKKFFIPCSEIARDELPSALKEEGADVVTVPVYNIGITSKESLEEKINKLNSIKSDLFIFTSPSTFRNFIQIMNISELQKYFNNSEIAVIGPTTKSEIENYGLKVDIFPDEYTMDGLIHSVIEYYKLK